MRQANVTSKLSLERSTSLRICAERWVHHSYYWNRKAKLQVTTIRHEDLQLQALPTLLRTLAFLLPHGKLPSLSSLSLTVPRDYVSIFRSWRIPAS
jgi:hypothetical protein